MVRESLDGRLSVGCWAGLQEVKGPAWQRWVPGSRVCVPLFRGGGWFHQTDAQQASDIPRAEET